MEQTIFEAAGGSQAFVDLAHAWHRRCLDDPLVSHAFSHGYRDDHSERLAAYWAEALGGPPAFTDELGDHTEVVRMHAGNGEHLEMDRRAIRFFAQAMDDAGLPEDDRLRTALLDYFAWATNEMMTRHHAPEDVPEGLPLPRWSWSGLVTAR